LRFSIYPGKIIVDSNGDAVQADRDAEMDEASISTEAIGRKYLAKRRVLLQSIFRAVQEVQIQCATVSFALDDLETIAPIPVSTGLPDGIRTRLTLLLPYAKAFEKLVQEISSIPDTLLLFRSNIEELQIYIYPNHSTAPTRKIWTKLLSENSTRTIVQTEGLFAQNQRKVKYLVEHGEVQHLPDESDRPDMHDALILLAFPISEQNSTILEKQRVYSFLPAPLSEVGFHVSGRPQRRTLNLGAEKSHPERLFDIQIWLTFLS